MKRFLPLPLLFMLQGCLYFNDTGVSTHLYDNCKEYYDNCGIYHKECPPNLVDYKDMREEIKHIGTALRNGSTAEAPAGDAREELGGECVEPATVAP